jgi:hypothetical protein
MANWQWIMTWQTARRDTNSALQSAHALKTNASVKHLADMAMKPQLFVAQRDTFLQWETEHKLTKNLQLVAFWYTP